MKDLILNQKLIEKKIYLIRGQNVMLDSDLAQLYGVETRVLIQAVKRNINRFPSDFMFQLTSEEFNNLRSQIVISSHGGRRYLPYVFTEQGVAMLSSVLNSERAIKVNIAIMRVFVNIRKIVATNKVILDRLNELESKLDKKISTIFDVINMQSGVRLLEPSKTYSNKKFMRDIIQSCKNYIHWIDKYFSIAGLDLLIDGVNFKQIKYIKILMLEEKANDKFKSKYKDFKEEISKYGIDCQLRVIIDKKLGSAIHDRWLISDNVCYNLPSTDTIARGQYSEIKKTNNIPPFEDWWKKAKELVL